MILETVERMDAYGSEKINALGGDPRKLAVKDSKISRTTVSMIVWRGKVLYPKKHPGVDYDDVARAGRTNVAL